MWVHAGCCRPLDLGGAESSAADTNLFEDEIVMDGGIAAALKHSMMKGFMETKSEKASGRTVRDPSSLLAKNYSIEDKKHEYVCLSSALLTAYC